MGRLDRVRVESILCQYNIWVGSGLGRIQFGYVLIRVGLGSGSGEFGSILILGLCFFNLIEYGLSFE